jgi:hypothetical protein
MCDGSVVEGEMVFAYKPVLGVGELSSSSSINRYFLTLI